MAITYEKKIEFAIKLLQSIPQDCEVELAYSGGKDSDVILELAKMSGIKFRPIYKNTTIDPPGTIAHAKKNGVEIVQPKETFFELVKRKGCPTMRARFCCEVLKEYKICDRQIVGVRRSESTKRAKLYHEPETCRNYGGKKGKVRQYYPILEWTDKDVERFIKERGIKCAPVYYDEQGDFHVERRLGCIGCPLKSDKGKSDYLKYPKMLRLLIKSTKVFMDTHPHSTAMRKFGDVYNLIYHNLFHRTYESYRNAVTGGLFPETAIDPKQFLEDFFGIDLTI